MKRLRYRPTPIAFILTVTGLIAAVLVVLTVITLRGGPEASDPRASDSIPEVSGPSPALEGLPEGLAPTLPGSGLAGTTALDGFGGLPGSGAFSSLPPREIQLQVTSAAAIGIIGYVIPTSLDDSNGVAENVGTSWSLNTTGYGEPDYAQIFIQAGAAGTPITCTITVDGQVTEQRTTQGPYGQLLCQG